MFVVQSVSTMVEVCQVSYSVQLLICPVVDTSEAIFRNA